MSIGCFQHLLYLFTAFVGTIVCRSQKYSNPIQDKIKELFVEETTKMAEMDYSAILEMSDPPNPNQQKIIKQVIDWFLGPDAQGKTSKDWSKRLLRPRPRLQSLSTTTEYATQYDTSIPLLPSSTRIPYPFIILGGVVILGMFYLLLFLIIDRLRCCRKEAARRKNRTRQRMPRRQTMDGLYCIENDSLRSGNVRPSTKVTDLNDPSLPSYEDAMLASQQQSTQTS